jgi:integrase
MKAGREHRVPLSDAARTVLSARPKKLHDATKNNSFVFPGSRASKSLSNMAFLMLLRRMKRGDVTAHGFRSTFADWCAETGKPEDIREAALAHMLGNKTVAAYQRGDLLEQRRRLIEAWAEFCCSDVHAAQ